ncbi:ubiquitin 3 binding protein But2 C-terminal domain-containing protein [Xylaria curta]|nr:ubiquitin 3 binding protein But2 C-terminal domain-containing protein [Xylaria curta]
MVQKTAAFSSLLGGAYALTMRQSGCSFHMRTEGALGAPVSQYESGQTRAGSNETPSSFTLNGNTLTDAKGRGCWWTPPAMVLQCDVGQTPESGFNVGCDGTVSYNGQTTFYECETGANDLRMIYSGPNGSQCSEITLHADGCYPSGCSGQGTGPGSGSGSASPASSTLPQGGPSSYPVIPSSPVGGSGGGSGSGSTPPGNSPSGTSPGSGPGGASPGSSGAGTQPLGGSTTYPGSPSYPTGTIGTSPGGEGSTPPGQYPGGTPTGGTSNGVGPTPSGSTPSGGVGSSTPSGQYPGSTPIGSTPTGGSGSTPSGQYPGSTPSESAPSGGAGSTPPGQYPGSTPSESTPNGASPTLSGSTPPGGSGTGSSTSPGEYPGSTPSGTTSNGAGSTPPGQYPTGTGSSPASTPGTPGQSGTPGTSCPGELTGAYQYPHLIIPVDSANANSAPGTSNFGEVTSTISTAFNFDIPQSDSGKTCNLVFYFPTQSQLETSSYTFSGSGAIEFGRLSSPVTKGTSYSSLPSVAESYGQKTVTPGSGHTISSFACPAGQSVAFEMKAAKGDTSTSFRYFQDYNPCPLGLYITVS